MTDYPGTHQRDSSTVGVKRSHERHAAIVQIFAWVLDAVLRTFKLQWQGYERSYVDLSERLLTMITSQERRLS